MVSVGSASFELKLDRSQFDKDIKQLGALKLAAIPAKLKLDTKDLDRQIKGLAGFIPAISIPVELDDREFRKKISALKSDFQIKAKIAVDDAEVQKAAKLKLKPEVELFEIGEDLTKEITKAIDEGFKKATPKKPGFFSKVFSGVGDTLLAPLKGIATGAFEGVGLQISKQLGLGLSRGIEAQFSSVLGSFELLGEKLISGIGTKLGGTVGGKIASAILNSKPLQNLRQDLANTITDIVGDSDRLVANQAGKQQAADRTKQQQKLAQRQLAQQLQQSILTQPQRAEQAKVIQKEQIPVAQQEVASASKQLESLQTDKEFLTSAGDQSEEIKQAIEEIDQQIDQATIALAQAVTKEKALQQQVVALQTETSKIVDKLKTAGADTSGVENIDSALKQSTVKGQDIIARLDGNIQIQQANIKEAKSRIKNLKEQERFLKQDAFAALGSGDEVLAKQLVTESKKSGLKANAAQQEVSGYKDNISQLVQTRREILKDSVEERKKLREQLESETQRLAKSLTNVEAASVAAPSRSRVSTKTKRAQAEKIAAPTQSKQIQQQEIPQVFKSIASQVAQLAQVQIDPSKIPRLARGAEDAKFTGKYSSFDNAVTLPGKSYDALLSGTASPEVIKTLVHELRHAMQAGFGARQLTESGSPGFDLIKGTSEELQQLGGRIDGSTQFFKKAALNAKPEDVETVRKLEEDAYVFAERHFQQVFQSIAQGLSKSGASSGDDLIKELQQTQAAITANLKQAFKGKPKDRKVVAQQLAESTLTEIDNQIAFIGEQLSRTDLSGEIRKKLGQTKGTLERQYRSYSPALRKGQPGSSSQQVGVPLVQTQQQVKGLELFEVGEDGNNNQNQERIKQTRQRLKEQAKQVRSAFKTLNRQVSKQEQEYAKAVDDRVNKSSKLVDALLNRLTTDTDAEVKEIQTEMDYQENSQASRSRRKIRSIQRRNGLEDNSAPQVDKTLVAPKSSGNPLQSFFKDFQGARNEAIKKQAQALNQQAQILLTDIQAQLVLGSNAQKEARVIEAQLKQNEKEIDSILNQIKRSQSGKDPKLTPGDLQRLSARAEELSARVDSDRDRLAQLQPAISNARDLKPVAKRLRNASQGATNAIGDKDSEKIQKYNKELRETLEILGEAPKTNFFEGILTGAGRLGKILPTALQLLKGFVAFQVTSFLQGFFTGLAKDAFQAYVEIDRLKTALNFASGGSIGGARNLAFVRKQVDDLGIPLRSAQQGFTKLAASARGTALEGQGIKDLFTGVSQASTVLSLSGEQNESIFRALSQSLDKGKISAEELRGQLGDAGLAGVIGIASRAIGVTEAEFSRLLDTGQVFSQDFLPKFAKQLQSEFGDAAKDASTNATSAVFKLENAFLSLQQGVGEGIAPAVVPGLTVLTTVVQGVSAVSRELGLILTSVSLVLSVNMVKALISVVQQLIATKLATGTLGGGFASLGQTINRSLSVQATVGIFALLEIVKLLSDAVNTDLVNSFDKVAKAAIRAADASEEAFDRANKNRPKPMPEAQSSNWFGQTADVGIKAINDRYLGFYRNAYKQVGVNADGLKLSTFGELERDNLTNSTNDQTSANKRLLASARLRLVQLRSGTGDIGQLPGVDSELRTAEQERQILQARIKREFTDRGQATPANLKQDLDAQNLKISDLVGKRADIAKPYTDDLNRVTQQIDAVKSQIESFKTPEAIAVFGEDAANKFREELELDLKSLKNFKAEAEATLGALRVDPVLAFTSVIRDLNAALAEGQERNQFKLTNTKTQISREQLAGFAIDPNAARNAALKSAIAEQEKAASDTREIEAAFDKAQLAANAPEFQPVLQRLGLKSGSSAAQIQSVIDKTSDEADKNILEKVKAARELQTKLAEARGTSAEAELKVSQQTQDNSLFNIQRGATNTQADIQQAENQKLAAIKANQNARLVTEQQAAQQIAQIQLQSTLAQQANTGKQLKQLRDYYNEGKIGAEEFANRQRELTTEQTNLEKTAQEQRFALTQAVNARILDEADRANAKLAANIQKRLADKNQQIKGNVLDRRMTKEQGERASTNAQIVSTTDDIELTKRKIAENEKFRRDGVRTAQDAARVQIELNGQLENSETQLLDLRLQAQQQYRDEVLRNIDLANKQAEAVIARVSTERAVALTRRQMSGGDLAGEFNQPKVAVIANQNDQATTRDEIEDTKRKIRLAEQNRDNRIITERQATEEILALNKDLASKNQQLINQQLDAERLLRDERIANVERVAKAEEARFKRAQGYIDSERANLDLYTQSLDRTAKLEESRYNLQKAVADAGTSDLEIRKDGANRALELSRRLKDENLDPSVKSEIQRQLGASGFGTDELSILNQRQKIEQEIADRKLEALKLEQQYQRQSLLNDLKRQKIQAQMAVYEAESARLSAAKSKLEAESALRVAEIKQDPVEVEIAKVGVELAGKETVLADRKLAFAQEGLSVQDEIARNSIMTQEAQQRAALSQQLAANSAQKQAQAMERVEASVVKSSNAMDNSKAQTPSDWVNPYIQKQGESMFDYANRINQDKIFGRLVETSERKTLAPIYTNQAMTTVKTPSAMPPTDTTGAQAKASEIKPTDAASGYTQFVDALKVANSGVEARLDKLIGSISSLSNAPRSLTVQSPNPVDDAASIFSDFAAMEVRGAGL